MIAARRRRQPSTIRTITQAGLNSVQWTPQHFTWWGKDDLRWFYNFEMVNLFPVFVFNMHFVPAKHSHQLSSTKTDLKETRLWHVKHVKRVTCVICVTYVTCMTCVTCVTCLTAWHTWHAWHAWHVWLRDIHDMHDMCDMCSTLRHFVLWHALRAYAPTFCVISVDFCYVELIQFPRYCNINPESWKLRHRILSGTLWCWDETRKEEKAKSGLSEVSLCWRMWWFKW